MNLRVLYHLMRADFLERVRGYRFLIILVGAIFLAYEVIIGNINVHVGPYRGIYNSAWVGMLMALMTAAYVHLPGFYIVKNAVKRDRETRVGEVLAPTQVSKLAYVSGKFLSNFAVLGLITVVMIGAAVMMQWSRAEEMTFAAWPLLAPFVLIVLPAFAFIAALALLFECIPWLAGGLGNVLYFFLWIYLLHKSVETNCFGVDLLGIMTVRTALVPAVHATFPGFEGSMSMGSGTGGYRAFEPFPWGGIDWTPTMIGARLFWAACALACVILATVIFDRLDPSRGRRALPRRKTPGLSFLSAVAARVSLPRIPTTRFVRLRPSNCFTALVLGELRLMLKGRHWLWYAGAAGLLFASLVLPLEKVQMKVIQYAWLWPILCWSALGVRESRCRTGEFILSSAHSLRRQLPAAWLAGVLVAVLIGSGVAVRLVIAGDLQALAAWAVGALFIPSMALACGILSGTSRLFEATYTVLVWYTGLLRHQPSLDFLTPALGKSLVFLILTLALLGVAFLGRRHQLQR